MYDPTEWLRIRATRSRDIRAPNFSELYERTESVGFTGTANPWTGGSDQALIASTGNIDVDAEEGDTETFGVVFSPQSSWGQGLRFSVDWWQIEIDGAIARLGSRDTSSTAASAATPCSARLSTATAPAV